MPNDIQADNDAVVIAPSVHEGLTRGLVHHIEEHFLTLLLVRHGQPGPGENVEGLQGKPLTEMGRRQAELVAQRLAQLPLDHIYCSDMARSYQTAEALRELRPEVPLDVLAELRETGAFHNPGRPPARTAEQRQKLHEQRQRVDRFVKRLRGQHQLGQVVTIITHGNINRLLLARMIGVPPRQFVATSFHHSSVSLAVVNEQRLVTLKLLNCIAHLPPELIGTGNL